MLDLVYVYLFTKVYFVTFAPFSCCDCLAHICRRRKELKARTVWLGCPEKCEEKFPKNAIKNQKYNLFTFVPGVSSCPADSDVIESVYSHSFIALFQLKHTVCKAQQRSLDLKLRVYTVGGRWRSIRVTY